MSTFTGWTRYGWRPALSRRETLVVSGVLASLALYLTTLLALLA